MEKLYSILFLFLIFCCDCSAGLAKRVRIDGALLAVCEEEFNRLHISESSTEEDSNQGCDNENIPLRRKNNKGNGSRSKVPSSFVYSEGDADFDLIEPSSYSIEQIDHLISVQDNEQDIQKLICQKIMKLMTAGVLDLAGALDLVETKITNRINRKKIRLYIAEELVRQFAVLENQYDMPNVNELKLIKHRLYMLDFRPGLSDSEKNDLLLNVSILGEFNVLYNKFNKFNKRSTELLDIASDDNMTDLQRAKAFYYKAISCFKKNDLNGYRNCKINALRFEVLPAEMRIQLELMRR
jgi:hypothetical protein